MDASSTSRSGAARVGPFPLVRLARIALLLSLLMLALAPLTLPGGYSVFDHTLSESGGQGVQSAWAHRSGVLLAAASVLTMTFLSAGFWSRTTRVLLRVYVAALVGLAAFPESAWDGRPFDETVAKLHTVSGAVGAAAFILAVVSVAASRPAAAVKARRFDLVVALSVALIPQVMLLTNGDGVWQRLMVALGYLWLLLEYRRLESHPSGAR